MRKNTKKRIDRINSSRVLCKIRNDRGISRIAVANDLDLDRSTITKVVRDLIGYGLVRTMGKYHGKPGVGRLATGLEIRPEFGFVLGIEVQTEKIRVVQVDLSGHIYDKKLFDYDSEKGSLEKQVVVIINEIISKTERADQGIIGIGIGLSGVVDPYKGVIRFSYPLGIEYPLYLRNYVEQATGLQVFIENDANCCCWGEMAFGKAKGTRNFISLLGEFRNIDIGQNRTSGIAFGIGIVIRDRVLHGDNFTVGEFRSLHYDRNKPTHSQFSITDEEAASLPENREVLENVFRDLSFNLSLIVNILDITKIVVAGDFARYSDILTSFLSAEIKNNCLYSQSSNCKIEYSDSGEDSVCIGAAGLVVQKLFSIPEMGDHLDERVGFILLEKYLSKQGVFL